MEFDEKRSQLYVYTTPNLHTTVAKVLDNIEAEFAAGADTDARDLLDQGSGAAVGSSAG